MTITTLPQVVANEVVIRGHAQQVMALRAEVLRLRFNAEAEAGVYGPFNVPSIPGGRSIVSAYAHPFAVVERTPSNPDQEAADMRVVRPYFSIRGPRTLVMFASDQFDSIDPLGAFDTINSLVTPSINGPASRWGLPGDFRADLLAQGVPTFAHDRHSRVVHVEEVDADINEDVPTGSAVYKIVLNSGHAVRVILPMGTEPSVDDEYPTGQEATRFSHDVGAIQKSLESTYPKQNGYVVGEDGDVTDPGYLGEHENPHAINSVVNGFDYPDNPTTPIKIVTLNSGATLKVSAATVTNVGAEIGDPAPTTTQQSLDVGSWLEIDVLLITAAYPQDDTLAGLAVDPFPISVGGTAVQP